MGHSVLLQRPPCVGGFFLRDAARGAHAVTCVIIFTKRLLVVNMVPRYIATDECDPHDRSGADQARTRQTPQDR